MLEQCSSQDCSDAVAAVLKVAPPHAGMLADVTDKLVIFGTAIANLELLHCSPFPWDGLDSRARAEKMIACGSSFSRASRAVPDSPLELGNWATIMTAVLTGAKNRLVSAIHTHRGACRRGHTVRPTS